MDEFIRKNDVYNLKNAFDSLVKKEIKCDNVENIIFAKAMETAFNMIEQAVREVPAADVVEVVRCKGCKFCDDAYCNDGRKLKDLYYCNWFGSVVEKNGFCRYGAKMDLERSK